MSYEVHPAINALWAAEADRDSAREQLLSLAEEYVTAGVRAEKRHADLILAAAQTYRYHVGRVQEAIVVAK